MPTIINADTATGGAIITGDTSGQLQLQSGGVTALTTTGANVAVAGALTMGTALSPANGGTGVTSPGASGNVLTSNGTTWVSQALAGNSITATATGSISNGAPVSVNSDGTVSTTTGVVGGIGNYTAIETNFASQPFYFLQAIYSPQGQKAAVFYYQTGGSYLLGKVGTFSGDSLSYGATTAILGYAGVTVTQSNFAAYSPDVQRIAVFYGFNSQLWGSLFSISGTSLSNTGNNAIASLGTNADQVSASYNDAAQGFVVVRRDSSAGTSFAVLISATTTSLSSVASASISAGNITQTASVYDANTQRTVIFYTAPSGAPFAIVCTTSSSSITLNTPVQVSGNNATRLNAVYDSNSQKIVVVYFTDTGNIRVRVGTVSGTTISFGTEVTVAASGNNPSIAYDAVAKKVLVSYYTGSSTSATGLLAVGTVSGTSISFTSPITYLSAGNTYLMQSAAYDANAQRVVLPYSFTSSFDFVQATSYQVPFTSATSFIGFSNAAYTNGQTATVQTVGAVDDAQTGLTAGQAYYVLPTGALSTTAGSPSVFAGTALSASRILVKG
jgi:hypothetical protein